MISWRGRLTGSEASLPDYYFQISTLTVNLKNAAPSYHTVTTPYSFEIFDAFLDRPNGLVWIQKDGVDWVYFNREEDVYSIGPRSGTFNARGYRTQTYSTPTVRTLATNQIAQESLMSDGTTSYMVDPALTFLPQDTFVYNAKNWRVNKVDIFVSVEASSLTINASEIV